MNPDVYPEPDRFEPGRYINHTLSAAEYINSNNPDERDHFSYGAGRRVCPGVHVAERSLYINIVRVLWGFDISKKKGPDGKLLEPDTRMVRGFLSVPEEFECEILPRSSKHEKLMRETFAAAEEEGLDY